ncbi:beta-galactosidase [Nocardioides sp. YR527]|uniref:glycoside hydrolase family 2 protein n=1 Tax=Nocardioides sp. YR527 TaxID=1881028 RepID=UPI00088CD6D5|nr:glycoside hydrolase family 2 TIM barrel-domain containing protein [Nocardioides sp. YR527]SDK47537.1 beta-galactosidase [Nocardioides sp. YR527]
MHSSDRLLPNVTADRRRFLTMAGAGAAAAAALPALGPVPAEATPAAASARRSVEVSSGWSFHLGEDAEGVRWERVDLPHTWNALDAQDGGGNYHRGTGWYRRHVRVPAEMRGQELFLEFGGASQVAEVYVDGTLVGTHAGAFGRFRLDVTEALRDGGTVAVKVDNALRADVAPLAGDFNVYGGLYRGVRLIGTARSHLDLLDSGGPGVIIRQRSLTDALATVEVTSRVVNPVGTEVITRVVDRRGRTVATSRKSAAATVQQIVDIPRPHRWDGPADPYLYTVDVSIVRGGKVLDAVAEPLGLRTIDVDANLGLLLNGRPYRIYGVNRHQDRADQGWAISQEQTVEDFALMREMGVTAVRLAHYPQDDFAYALADRYGILLYSEVPYVGGVPSPTGSNDSPELTANLVAQAREMVRGLGNHPSVAWWSIGNELGDTADVNANLAAIQETIKAEDPSRHTSYAHLSGLYPDESGVLDHADLSGYNRYDGWYAGTTADFGRWADELHATDPARRLGITEYGAGASVRQHQEWPGVAGGLDTRAPHPEEYQAYHHSQLWPQIAARPFLWGAFVWAMFDFASDARHEGDAHGLNDKGLVTYDRGTRKAAFYYFRSAWTRTPTLRLVERGWTERSEAATTVHVFSNADEVTLRLNGRVMGTTKVENHTAAFPLNLRPGANRVVATAVTNGRRISDAATWTL